MKQQTTIKVILGMLIALVTACLAILLRIRPQLQEEYVALQTVKLDGDVYVCGREIANRDTESLYCTGFTDGHNWAVQEFKIDQELNK